MTDASSSTPTMSSASATIRRVKHERQYVCVSNDVARDGRLTLRARGLLVHLLSLPDGWEVSSERLADACIEGRDAIRKTLTELEQYGYVLRQRERSEAGTVRTIVLVDEAGSLDSPTPGKPVIGLTRDDTVKGQVAPATEKPGPGSPGVKERPSTKTKKKGPRAGTLTPSLFEEGSEDSERASASPFDEWWATYPRKIDKKPARVVYDARLREGVEPGQLLLAAKHYAQTREGEPIKFTKHPKTFLAKDGPWTEWVDGPPEGNADTPIYDGELEWDARTLSWRVAE